MANRTFGKAIRLLCSPFSLTAMLLLLVNDQLLRVYWPSWWTGKLGDFAWLFFFPFALAVVLAWLIPPRLPRQERIVQWLAFGLTGGVFALAKTLPPFHDLLVRVLEALLGAPVALVRDPSDLLALVSLGMSWRFWQRRSQPASFRAAPGWAVLSSAALLTIANSAMPDEGVVFVCSTRQLVYAGYDSPYRDFVSADGGLSWTYNGGDDSDDCKSSPEVDSNVRYRFDPDDDAIERTEDGGQSWQRESAPSTGQAAGVYYKEKRCGESDCLFEPGPRSATVDPATGNVIFAMGVQGVLVRESNGEWAWASVGRYSRLEPGLGDMILTLLSGEMLLALGFALLSILTLLRRLHTSRLRRILLVLFWLLGTIDAILAFAILHDPAFGPEEATYFYALTFAACLVVAFLVLWDMPAIAQHAPALPKRLAVVALGIAVLFLIPYLLWVLDVVPEYYVSVLLAFALGIAALFRANRWTSGLVQAVREKETAEG
jgi:hypothetical protein